MTNKVAKFLLEHFPEIVAETKAKIQEIEDTMIGAEGKEKKAELDKQIIAFISNLIRTFDIPQIPNIIEDNIIDPATIKLIEIYLPAITQSIYNVGVLGIQKLNDNLKNN